VELVPPTSVVRATWRSLLQPRRLVPIAAVSVPLVLAQARWSDDARAVPLALSLLVAFVAVGPLSYRVLFPDGLDFSHGAARVVLFGLVGAGLVLSLGAVVPKVLDMGSTFLTERPSLLAATALFLAGSWGLARDIGFEQRLERLQAEHERAQLAALKAHIDPHFLFNTLNAIAEWCRLDGAMAERAVLTLSELLRAMLAGARDAFWPLQSEVELVRRLADLHSLRDPSHFTLEEQLPQPLPPALVPPLCVLTLMENAMKHGPGAGHPGAVRLTARFDPAARTVTVQLGNPGPYGGPREGGEGLHTLERHLAAAWGPLAHFSIAADGPDRTLATLTFPWKEA
jgi:two-component system, LytTR family, sensor histidine kinase AlgZ